MPTFLSPLFQPLSFPVGRIKIINVLYLHMQESICKNHVIPHSPTYNKVFSDQYPLLICSADCINTVQTGITDLSQFDEIIKCRYET